MFRKKAKEPIKIAIASGKGGVGKSSITNHLAHTLTKSGYKVGIIDADIYGPTQTRMLGILDQACEITDAGMIVPLKVNGIHVVSSTALVDTESAIVWRAPIATRLLSNMLDRVLWPNLDYILIDLPPGTGDIQITIAQKAELQGGIIVTTPQQVATKIAEKAIQLFNKVNIPTVGIIENMSAFACESCGHQNHIFSDGGAQELADTYATAVLGNIPLHQDLMQLGDQGLAITTLKNKHPLRIEYENIVNKIINSDILKAITKHNVQVSSDKDKILITYPNNLTKSIDAFSLRYNCQCANCVDEFSQERVLQKEDIATDITINSSENVGRYGIRVHFSDGHNTGIYPFKNLKTIKKIIKPTGSRSKVSAKLTNDYTIAEVQEMFDEQINPQVKAHGGHIKAIKIAGNTLSIEMSGGCQGCSQANTTIKQGVEVLVRKFFPELTAICDNTAHELGTDPYYG